MLTKRQKEILSLIVQLYSRFEEPIGSKTVLRESLLQVSPATIRNDMAVLESQGLLVKPHTSSGRVPSLTAYHYYVSRIMNMEDKRVLDDDDINSLSALIEAKANQPIQSAQLAADIMVSLTNYTVLVLGQDQEAHRLEEFKLVPLNRSDYLAILITDTGRIESEIVNLKYQFTREELDRIVTLVNEELHDVTLEEVYQRMKLSIPLLTQRAVGYQVDFLSLIEKARDNLRGHHYYVSGKDNLFDLMNAQMSKEAFKDILEIVDGSRKMYQVLESCQTGVDVKFGYEFLKHHPEITMVSGSFAKDNQKIVLAILGPKSMVYERIIPMLDKVIHIIKNQ